jgi:tetratricopeptide (TPR) repeat protein
LQIVACGFIFDPTPNTEPLAMPKRPKDVDIADQVFRARALFWSLIAGPVFGGIAGALIAKQAGVNVVVGGLIGMPVGWWAVYRLTMKIVSGAVKTAEQIYNPSGETTPRRAEYSYAQSLVMRGRYEEALAAYELHAIENADDPEPYFQAARICRDHLERYDDAVSWFRRARADAMMTRGQEVLAIQEIIELYMRKLKTPRRAIPELAMMVDRFPDTEHAEAARRELGELREMLAREHEGYEKFTEQFLKKIGRHTLSQAAGLTREEIERQLIAEALEEAHGDRRKAAEKIGITEEKLADAMKELGI